MGFRLNAKSFWAYIFKFDVFQFHVEFKDAVDGSLLNFSKFPKN